MREKINAAVAEVRKEVAEGRLGWSYDDILRVLVPYPKHSAVDAILANIGDETNGLLEDADEGFTEDHGGQHSETGSEPEEDDWAAAPEEEGSLGAEGALGEEAPPPEAKVSPAVAERIAHSRLLRTCYETMQAECEHLGNMKLAQLASLENKKEERRIRELSRDDGGVLAALADHNKAAVAAERLHRRQVADLNASTTNLKEVKRKIEEASAELKKKQRALADTDATWSTRSALRNMSLAELGRGVPRAKAKANRASVLDRVSRLGSGLSPAQKNVWLWFKENWDARMFEEHKDEWPQTFAGWMQRVLQDMDNDPAAFSQFVHKETLRCFGGELALQVPGQGDASQSR